MKDKYKRRFHGRHLGFKDGRQRYKFENVLIELVDLQNVYLDTKIMFLRHLEAEIFTILILWPPLNDAVNRLTVTSEMMPHDPDGA